MRVIVCGGRDYTDIDRVTEIIDGLIVESGGGLLVVQGGARGADRLARVVCGRRGVSCATFAADWGRWGRGAGPRRNQTMLDVVDPDVVVAFPGGRGTADMTSRAERTGVAVRRVQ